MSSSISEELPSFENKSELKPRERKQKRAEREIYRPGALRAARGTSIGSDKNETQTSTQPKADEKINTKPKQEANTNNYREDKGQNIKDIKSKQDSNVAKTIDSPYDLKLNTKLKQDHTPINTSYKTSGNSVNTKHRADSNPVRGKYSQDKDDKYSKQDVRSKNIKPKQNVADAIHHSVNAEKESRFCGNGRNNRGKRGHIENKGNEEIDKSFISVKMAPKSQLKDNKEVIGNSSDNNSVHDQNSSRSTKNFQPIPLKSDNNLEKPINKPEVPIESKKSESVSHKKELVNKNDNKNKSLSSKISDIKVYNNLKPDKSTKNHNVKSNNENQKKEKDYESSDKLIKKEISNKKSKELDSDKAPLNQKMYAIKEFKCADLEKDLQKNPVIQNSNRQNEDKINVNSSFNPENFRVIKDSGVGFKVKTYQVEDEYIVNEVSMNKKVNKPKEYVIPEREEESFEQSYKNKDLNTDYLKEIPTSKLNYRERFASGESSGANENSREDFNTSLNLDEKKPSKVKSYSEIRKSKKTKNQNYKSEDQFSWTQSVKKDEKNIDNTSHKNQFSQMRLNNSNPSRNNSRPITRLDSNEMEDEDYDCNQIKTIEIKNSRSSFDPYDAKWNSTFDTGLSNKSKNQQSISWADSKSFNFDKKNKKKNDPRINKRQSNPRGGLIQIPGNNTNTSSTNDNSCSPAPVQKLLYNPNNPDNPVAVIPSQRDLPSNYDNLQEAREQSNSPSGFQRNLSPEHTDTPPKIDQHLLYNIHKGEMDIAYYIGSNQLPREFPRIMDIRIHLQKCYQTLLVTDIRFCQDKNIENMLWKSLYYSIIEKLREYIGNEPTLKDRSLATLQMLVDEGQNYLQDLLEYLQVTYQFSLESQIDEEIKNKSSTRNKIRLALMSSQKLLLYLGDLSRYREQYNSNPNYNLAKKWYLMALQVYPRNGRPFNQLAIVAVIQKRPLDVVYYYIRSLSAANPFASARDSLINVYEDMRRKYESAIESEKRKDQANNVSTDDNRKRSSHLTNEGLRQEIWIRPDSGATNKRTISQSSDVEQANADLELLTKENPDKLMKQFLTSYLNCHGMLFSKVGLDNFHECCTSMLKYFTALLRMTPPRLSSTHLLQIMALNMFAVENTQLRDTRLESGYRSAAQDLALVLGQEMFGKLAEVVVRLLPHHLYYSTQDARDDSGIPIAGEPHRLFMPDLAHFIPAIKIWCDWLLYHSSAWNPPPQAPEYNITNTDCWSIVAELATIINGLGPADVSMLEVPFGNGSPPVDLVQQYPDHLSVVLPEDTFLKGYSPLIEAQRMKLFLAHPSTMERARDWCRVSQMKTVLTQFLCGVDPPVLQLQKTEQGDILINYITITPPDTPSCSRESMSGSEVSLEDCMSDLELSDSEDDLDHSSDADTDDEPITPLSSMVKLLAKRKKVLERKQQRQRRMQALMDNAVTLEMEVRPRYLIPDTNCFIEQLDIIKALVTNTPYTVMVPLIVLNELDGLSRDAAVEKYGSVAHAVHVREGAAAALHYIRNSKHNSLKCVTSQGSVLSSATFTAEIDVYHDVSNDDKILSCCLHFCSDCNKRRPIKEGVRRLYREVVLLTEDRNLKVKAYARDVPVRDLANFAQWAGVK